MYPDEGSTVAEGTDASDAGRALSKRGASKGGRARASVLTPTERSEIARRASRVRWDKEHEETGDGSPPSKPPVLAQANGGEPEMPYSMFPGTLSIGDVTFECHVLSDGKRVLTAQEVVRVLTGVITKPGSLSRYLERLPTYREEMLAGRTVNFMIPQRPQPAYGYEAELLIEICEMYLAARDRGMLKRSQDHLAKTAEIVVRACAKVGIIALIDEATGYQAVREKNALQLKLQAFIADDLQEWAKMFPDEFWYELARLEGVRHSPRHRPIRWGRYVMAFVYDAIDKDVGQELRKINPGPRHRRNHHQWLREFGRERVHRQIGGVIAVMKLCDDMAEFKRKFKKVFDKESQLSFDGIDWRK